MSDRPGAHAGARRLEEMALTASGAFQSPLNDGWLLGHRPGPTNAAALAVYRRFGFAAAYDYGYRARSGDQH
ncbi:MAG: hypothetical protein ACREYD_13420 [Casimicrobiaceae bacterium]